MPSTALFLKCTGAVLVLHAAYSCMHYRSILQDLDLLDTSSSSSSSAFGDVASASASSQDAAAPSMMIPPMDVYIEVALAFCLLLLGELLAMGPLQSVELTSSKSGTTSSRKPLVAPAHKTRDFDIYNNRSKILLHRATAAKTL